MRIDRVHPGNMPTAPRHLFISLGDHDMMQLTQRCIGYPDDHFVIVPGVLGNARKDKPYGSGITRRRITHDGTVCSSRPRSGCEMDVKRSFRRLRLTRAPDADANRTGQAKARAQRWPFLKVPRYSMPQREGAIVRLEIGQGAS
ncbi:hypothetical protein RI103_32795 [Paraburkholderia sp. FT54]|uniref:hypothetical protein n=1 Tax=Paraburkholderia sp. FT54 TaxID=3074437 RepID=UPI0028778F1C|nr:hypothetical protein [Paraburkholderia sp. FT54]WNC94727.1 hypothetical protein RI103_32795 [Paraburkholderia sp. FT54]